MSFYSLVFISQSPFFHCHLQQYFKYTPILERKHFVLVPSLLPCILSSGLLYFRGVHAALNLYRRDGDIWNSNSACFCISIALFCGGEQNSLKAGQNGQRTDISVLLLWTADIIYPTRLGGKAGRDSRLLKATFVTGWWGSVVHYPSIGTCKKGGCFPAFRSAFQGIHIKVVLSQ